MAKRKIQVVALLICSGFLSGDLRAATPSLRGEDSLARQVEADWVAQERRWNRTPDSPQAVREALQRAERLLADLERALPDTELEPEAATLRGLHVAVDAVDHMASEQRSALYTRLRWTTRNLSLKNPLLAGKPLVFMKRHRFVSQMLHEYLGYFCDYGDVAGGGVFVLENPGRSFQTRDLIAGRLPRGNYTTLALSYDGGLAFMSTRRGGFGRCHNPWEPLPAYTLHRMKDSVRRGRASCRRGRFAGDRGPQADRLGAGLGERFV